MKYLKLLVFVIFIGCGAPKILYDYDGQANFNSYKTFRFNDDIILRHHLVSIYENGLNLPFKVLRCQ